MDWFELIQDVMWTVDKEGEYTEYPYHVSYTYDDEEIWADDYRTPPDDNQIYNNMLEAFKNDCFRLDHKYYSEWFGDYARKEL